MPVDVMLSGAHVKSGLVGKYVLIADVFLAAVVAGEGEVVGRHGVIICTCRLV